MSSELKNRIEFIVVVLLKFFRPDDIVVATKLINVPGIYYFIKVFHSFLVKKRKVKLYIR